MRPPEQTPLQKRYYWAIVRLIAGFWMPAIKAQTAEKFLHEEFKGMILGFEEVLDKDGESVVRPISTTTLDRDEFSGFVESVIKLAIDSGVPMPDSPEEMLEIAPRVIQEPLPSPGKQKKRRKS